MNPFMFIVKGIAKGMLKFKLKKWLGVDKLEKRVQNLENASSRRGK
ncbi:MAG: hypothetical protein JWO15_3612 [Sphingomonadales bacterium]|nr:hypothetical protein [Sphingomonadales bacterium]